MKFNPKINDFTELINNNLLNCVQCKNHNTKGGVFSSTLNLNIDVLFIAQNPGKTNYNKTVHPSSIVPFGLDNDNAYHIYFDKVYDLYKKRTNNTLKFIVTNLVKCVTKDNSLDDEMITNCYKKYLSLEMAYMKNTPIIGLGNYVMDFLISKKINKCKSIPHPGFLNRNRFLLEKHVKDSVDFIIFYK